jgi:hypothetical protein
LAFGLEQWKRVVLLVLLSGSGAVAINLLLNWHVTGHPTVAAYQIVAARDEGPSQSGGLLNLLRQLLIPLGIPDAPLVGRFLTRYWLEMGPIAGLTLSQVLLVPLVLRRSRWSRLAFVSAIVVAACFVLSRIGPDLNGASERVGLVHHSMPRYWSPVYLLAALTPVVALGRAPRRAVLILGSALLASFSLLGGYEIYAREKYALSNLRDFAARSARSVRALEKRIPAGAMVYSATHDKILWPYWRVGTIDEPRPSARSLSRAAGSGLRLFVYEPALRGARRKQLERALRGKRLSLVAAGEKGLYRVTAGAEP